MRRFIKDNRGMTLIELIIAITILGLVATPLLHGFLTSAQTEVKARKMGEVTSVAQNIMEVVEGAGYDTLTAADTDLKTLFGIAQGDTPQIVTTGDGKSVIKMTGLNVAGKMYNATVDINPLGYAALNNFGLSVNSGMDIKIEVPKLAKENIKDNVERDITVDITLDSTSTKLNILVKHEDKEIKEENYNISSGLPSVYIFYYPSYKVDGNTATIMKDNIYISNKSGLKLDLYLIKQKDNTIAATPAFLDSCEQLTECYVEQCLTEYDKENGKVGATIYTNITENLKSGETLNDDKLIYKIKYGENQYVSNTSFGLNTKKIQIETKPSTRIYQVTVKVFSADNEDFSGEPLGTLTGSILK